MSVRVHILSLIFVVPAFPKVPSEGEKLFSLHVKPLFAEKCMACHGDDPEKIKSDFDMRTRKSMLQGGEIFEDEVLIPGQGAKSYLYILSTRVEDDLEMPPKESDKLTKDENGWLREWIDYGAPWPSEQRIIEIQDKYAEGVQVVTSKALSENWQNRRYEPENYGHTVQLKLRKYQREITPWIGLLIESWKSLDLKSLRLQRPVNCTAACPLV